MEQRRLRLGDILDDYCPRERRVTNHAIVAMIEEDIKQTRCTTCDSEHAYKGARIPKRRKKETPAALYKEVLAALPESAEQSPVLALPVRDADPPHDVQDDWEEPPVGGDNEGADRPVAAHADDPSVEEFEAPLTDDSDRLHEPVTQADQPVAAATDGPVHRPLIRATLPRPEGQKDARPVPEFTVRHAPQRGSGNGHGHRGSERVRMRANGFGHGQRDANGNRGQGQRFHGNRSGGGRPQTGRPGAPGFRQGGSNSKRGRGSRG